MEILRRLETNLAEAKLRLSMRGHVASCSPTVTRKKISKSRSVRASAPIPRPSSALSRSWSSTELDDHVSPPCSSETKPRSVCHTRYSDSRDNRLISLRNAAIRPRSGSTCSVFRPRNRSGERVAGTKNSVTETLEMLAKMEEMCIDSYGTNLDQPFSSMMCDDESTQRMFLKFMVPHIPTSTMIILCA